MARTAQRSSRSSTAATIRGTRFIGHQKKGSSRPKRASKDREPPQAPEESIPSDVEDDDPTSSTKKWREWSKYAKSSPFPDFKRPTPKDCQAAHRVLKEMHGADVEEEFDDPDTPETIPHVLDAMIVAVLSQATGWNNAKRAMNSMKQTYGSVFAYKDIMNGGPSKLEDTIRCGGLHVRKTKIIMSILHEVKQKHGEWNLDHLLDLREEDAMKELLSYKYMGPKSAGVVVSWSLKRKTFIVDTHCYRIAGLWSWRPEKATREKTQSHLNARIPEDLKFDLHFLMIAHGRGCPACKGGAKGDKACEALKAMNVEK